jgi:hypothetical protein
MEPPTIPTSRPVPFAVRRSRIEPSPDTIPPPTPVPSERRHGPRAGAADAPLRRPRTSAQSRPITGRPERPTIPTSRPVPFAVRRSRIRPSPDTIPPPTPVPSERRHGPRAGAADAPLRRPRTSARSRPITGRPERPTIPTSRPPEPFAVRRSRIRPSPDTIPPPTPVPSERRHGPRAGAADAPLRRPRTSALSRPITGRPERPTIPWIARNAVGRASRKRRSRAIGDARAQ